MLRLQKQLSPPSALPPQGHRLPGKDGGMHGGYEMPLQGRGSHAPTVSRRLYGKVSLNKPKAVPNNRDFRGETAPADSQPESL